MKRKRYLTPPQALDLGLISVRGFRLSFRVRLRVRIRVRFALVSPKPGAVLGQLLEHVIKVRVRVGLVSV